MVVQNPKSKVAGELVAWSVEIHSMTCIAFAISKAKAQWIATKSYWEAYGKNGWPRAVARRAERYDKSAVRFQTPQRAWTEDYVLGYPERAQE